MIGTGNPVPDLSATTFAFRPSAFDGLAKAPMAAILDARALAAAGAKIGDIVLARHGFAETWSLKVTGVVASVPGVTGTGVAIVDLGALQAATLWRRRHARARRRMVARDRREPGSGDRPSRGGSTVRAGRRAVPAPRDRSAAPGPRRARPLRDAPAGGPGRRRLRRGRAHRCRMGGGTRPAPRVRRRARARPAPSGARDLAGHGTGVPGRARGRRRRSPRDRPRLRRAARHDPRARWCTAGTAGPRGRAVGSHRADRGRRSAGDRGDHIAGAPRDRGRGCRRYASRHGEGAEA